MVSKTNCRIEGLTAELVISRSLKHLQSRWQRAWAKVSLVWVRHYSLGLQIQHLKSLAKVASVLAKAATEGSEKFLQQCISGGLRVGCLHSSTHREFGAGLGSGRMGVFREFVHRNTQGAWNGFAGAAIGQAMNKHLSARQLTI